MNESKGSPGRRTTKKGHLIRKEGDHIHVDYRCTTGTKDVRSCHMLFCTPCSAAYMLTPGSRLFRCSREGTLVAVADRYQMADRYLPR